MTVNIGLATSDALVFGCDSVASTTSHLLDVLNIRWERDEKGEILTDANGKITVKFGFDDLTPVVTDAWGGVAKMFEIYHQPSPVVAVTSGLAKLKDRPIASYASEFLISQKSGLARSEDIAQEFLTFMRTAYDAHYEGSDTPEVLRDGPEFLVGGYGAEEGFPSIYRIKVKNNTLTREFGEANAIVGKTGVSWNGQSGSVERFMRGYDWRVRTDIEKTINNELKNYVQAAASTFADFVNELLTKLGKSLPDGMKFEMPPTKTMAFDWENYAVGIDFANLPLQEAINLVGFLVMLQAGKSRFARGIATVGGRIHIGVVTKERGFKALGETELSHRLTGFSDDV